MNIERHQVIESCEGCARIEEVGEDMFCKTYPNPAAKWRLGKCNFATHVKELVQQQEVKLNPLKASKRAAKGK